MLQEPHPVGEKQQKLLYVSFLFGSDIVQFVNIHIKRHVILSHIKTIHTYFILVTLQENHIFKYLHIELLL